MTDERLVLAVGRLERAIARLEALPPPRPSSETVSRGDYAALEARHRRLRDSTASALAGIDRLIGPEPVKSAPAEAEQVEG
ncbi:MAG: hypothetical protein JOY99_09625 [Sphingomonadaceae bacterium]|nr:hypothetical protein [Sphingomonadaceae bacterium]